MDRVSHAVESFLKKTPPAFDVGDTVDVHVRIQEGDKERVQLFTGIVLCKKNRGIAATFTVRRIVQGEGVERIFPLHSPFVADIKVKRRHHVHRSKLYYLRERSGKSARMRERIDMKELLVPGEATAAPEAAPATKS
ncbi:MAG: 50S ribosomal protein L19 [Planctomycetes bacterium]|nr:50S ribosomal protein L19 [Planctomycetota bacterium]